MEAEITSTEPDVLNNFLHVTLYTHFISYLSPI
jgi:hypothetical protein